VSKYIAPPTFRSFGLLAFGALFVGLFVPLRVSADVSSPTLIVPAGIRRDASSPVYLNVATRQGFERFVLRRRAPLMHGPVFENGQPSARKWDGVVLFEGVARERGARKNLRPRQIRGDVIGNRLRLFFSGRRNGRPFVLKTRGLDGESRARIAGVPLTKRIQCTHRGSHLPATEGVSVSAHLPATLPATGTVSLFTPPRVVEIGIDADFEFFQQFGAGSLAEMLAILNAAEAQYTDQIGVSFKVVSSRVSTNPSNPSASKDAETLLDQYRSFIIGFVGGEADLFHLFTGKEPITFGSGVVVGLAGSPGVAGQPGPLCVDPSNGFGFSAPVPESLKGILTAHELGHNMGATHPDQDFPTQDLPPSIMTSFIEPAGNQFSQYSRGQLADQIIDHGECLDIESKYLSFTAKVTGSRFQASFVPTSAMGSGCKTSIYASKVKSDLMKRLTGGTRLNLTTVRKGQTKVLRGTVKNSGSLRRFYVRAVTYCTKSGVKDYQGSPILTLKARDADPVARLKSKLK